jgi:class 3 adenylate cyclase
MRRKFIAYMLVLVPVDAGITGIFIAVSGRANILLDDIALNITVFGLLNALLACWLFHPIHAFLRGRGNAEAAEKRTHQLAVFSSIQAGCLAILYCLSAAYIGVFAPNAESIDSLSPGKIVAVLFWYSFIYVVFYSFVVFFVVNEFVGGLKQKLALAGLTVRPAGHRIVYKLVFVIFSIAVVPIVLVILDLTVFFDFRTAQGLTTTQIIFLDLFASAFVIAVSLYFVTRGFVRPINALMNAVVKLRAGNLSTKVEITADDELGELTGEFNSMIGGLRERAYIRETFGRFVPERVAATLLDASGDLEPRAATATILFTDIEGFTSIAESKEPAHVVRMLNEYFSSVTGPIGRFNGTVNQFQGDAMLVTFNVPVDDPDHADNAVRAALAIQEATRGRTFAGVPLRTRAGINTGEVVAGPVGSEDRLTYTVHGNAVNIAARLEQLNKEMNTSLLVSETTLTRLKGDYAVEEIGLIPVRGVTDTVRVFRVDGETS